MDDSQGSEILSISVDMFCDSPTNHQMDQDTYLSLITNTKSALSTKCEIQRSSFYAYFTSLLNDCYMSISKTLDLITELFSESDFQLNKLVEYINSSVDILNMLSDYIKNLVETGAFTNGNLKKFPGTTARILIIVFTHCRDSESIYGSYLGTVEKQLKELFRMCHKLQLTYLLILEKHYLFDFTEKENYHILVEALELNLHIGEIVHKLDAKTMAEQWKAFTAICEKYTLHLNGKDIIYNCIRILCEIIEDNVKNAEKINQDEKVLMRSCKVTCFIIKILIKVYNLFKHAINMYDHILQLLIFAFLNSEPVMELSGKSSNYITLINTNIMVPMECLLKELLQDDKFVQHITTYDMKDGINKDNILGFILLIGDTMKILLQIDNLDQKRSNMKTGLIQCIYRILPYCHIWFNTGLKFKVEPLAAQHITIGLNEYLLVNTTSLVATMTREEYYTVEECMTNALLSTDTTSAMFSANLWSLLSRYSPKELILSQVNSLCKFYVQLENNVLFEYSPQKVHLTFTIAKLFETMNNDETRQLYEELPLYDNFNIWSILEIKYLPEEIRSDIESLVLDELKSKLSNLSGSNLNSYKALKNFTNLMYLASAFPIKCSLLISDVVCMWLKLCPENNSILVQHFKNGTLWCVKFMEALTSLTCSMSEVLCGRHDDLAKVFHVISKLVKIDCIEIKLLSMEILCKFSTTRVCDSCDIIERLVVKSFRNIMQSEDSVLTNKLFSMLQENVEHVEFNKTISKAIQDRQELKQTWLQLKKYGYLKRHSEKLLDMSNYDFAHKCIKEVDEVDQCKNDIELSRSDNNFDFVDIDALFGNETDSEPQCKKIKLSPSEVNDIIARLEADVSTLHKVRENITSEHKLKIKEIYRNLQNIAD